MYRVASSQLYYMYALEDKWHIQLWVYETKNYVAFLFWGVLLRRKQYNVWTYRMYDVGKWCVFLCVHLRT